MPECVSSRENEWVENPKALNAPKPAPFQDSEDEDQKHVGTKGLLGTAIDEMDEIPIELTSLTDSFLDSLSAKVHASPPTIEKLSTLFQEFYITAANHVNTHISAISSRQHRQSSPARSIPNRRSTTSRFGGKTVYIGSKDKSNVPLIGDNLEQQMLTPEEIAERRTARKLLEQKRAALEEAIEKRVCSKVYDKIWRHRSTQDEAQDEKFRSKTAALAVVGIGLSELGIDVGRDNKSPVPMAPDKREEEVCEWLASARRELSLMDSKRYPLGKIQHLKAAHKGIVDTLSHFHPSSSADEIMPTLIYTLITSPPASINVVSNLFFIQRFRAESKIDGEAAYCLTNLEAAIRFLETVDLASLRTDEMLSGPPKPDSKSFMTRLDPPRPIGMDNVATSAGVPSPTPISPTVVSSVDSNITPMSRSPSPNRLRPAFQLQNRSLSGLFQPPSQALGAAGDAVLNTADYRFKSIGESLGNSLNFLLGRLKEHQDSDGRDIDTIVPKTLDDARKLVGTPPLDEDGSASGTSSVHNPEISVKADDKVLDPVNGCRPSRDQSVESDRSADGDRKVVLAEEGEMPSSPLSITNLTAPNPAIVESMRNLGSTLNPMSRIAGMGMMRGFGKSAANVFATTQAEPALEIPDGGIADIKAILPEVTHSPQRKEAEAKIAPPIKRFMEVRNPGELRINEVYELIRDYRRLAGALKSLGAI
ncbi:MAG: hypothetical protein M1818_004725 [Claussenomyces sp. TS43310]|nr:MAG: hypothetical protein M1818_004725 [Claussenomyces sp. TS43310]